MAPSRDARRILIVLGASLLVHLVGLWLLQAIWTHRDLRVEIPSDVAFRIVREAPASSPVQPATVPPKEVAAVGRVIPKPISHQEVKTVNVPDTAHSPLSYAGLSAAQPEEKIAASSASVIETEKPQGNGKSAAADRTKEPSFDEAMNVELPSSSAEYLHNPKPAYPRVSKAMGEQGLVVVSVFIGTDGVAHDARIKASSGFQRLDDAAFETVKSWRYVPGKRAGVPEAMWYSVPVSFLLN